MRKNDAAAAWNKKRSTCSNFISKQKKMIWTKKLTQKYQNKIMLNEIYEPYTNHTQKRNVISDESRKLVSIKKRFLRTKFRNNWTAHSTIYQNQLTFLTSAQAEYLKKMKMKWHIKLTKRKNSLITQMRIEKIEFMKFLHIHKILKFTHLNCFCEASKQTLKHVVINCFLMSNKNKI